MRCSQLLVAPLVGAWIEIQIDVVEVGRRIKSLPSWERGLKLMKQESVNPLWVAPLVGAWIEIL